MQLTINPQTEQLICKGIGCTSPFAHLPGLGRLAYQVCLRASDFWERPDDLGPNPYYDTFTEGGVLYLDELTDPKTGYVTRKDKPMPDNPHADHDVVMHYTVLAHTSAQLDDTGQWEDNPSDSMQYGDHDFENAYCNTCEEELFD